MSSSDQLSFTVSFHYQNGVSYFDGFILETVVSENIGAKYRVLVKKPGTDDFYTMKGMEEPMNQDGIDVVLREKHNGSIPAKEFVFQVFDNSGSKKLFESKFNVAERIPQDGYGSDKMVVNSFSWSFDLPL